MSARRRGLLPALVTAGAVAATLAGASPANADTSLGYDPATTKGSLQHIAQAVGAQDAYRAGFTGKGVGVALIDTGVTEVPGLDTGNVVHGPDLSFDSQDPELVHKDAFGHGTHLASIMVGRDAAGTPASYTDPSRFAGIAPDATLLSVKVGASDGSTNYNLANPARDPYVLAVGADDTAGTLTPDDDLVPSWGTRGTNQRHVDVV